MPAPFILEKYMNIIVCVKQVPGTTQVEIDPETGVLKRDGVAGKLNPYDLFALETALKLAEQTDGSVTTLSMGPPQAADALKETLWMGASAGILLSDRKFGGADVAATSTALSLGVKEAGDFDLVICGKQTTDGDTAQVGPELAERLRIEHAANIIEIKEVGDGYITCVMDMDSSFQTLKIKLPCLITMDKDTCTPRLPSYRKKKAISGKENIRVLTAADIKDADPGKLGLKGSPTQVERIFPPEKNTDKKILNGTGEELAGSLYEILSQKKFI